MKVTVCFGDIRVVVPCGEGQLTVAELTKLAIARYKKAINKSQEFWIAVQNLKSSDGGILDPDDKVSDVIDDKEQIKATVDVNFLVTHQNTGDGTSASSVGTSSPDVFRWGKDVNADHLQDWSGVVTGGNTGTAGSSIPDLKGKDTLLEVIRVDPSPLRPYGVPLDTGASKLNNDLTFLQQASQSGTTTRRPTHLPAAVESNGSSVFDVNSSSVDSPSRSFDDSAFRAFMRTASRKSLNNGTAMLQWLEAQERVQDGYMRTAREEPIGSSDEAEIIDNKIDIENESSAGTLVEMRNPGGPLGVHVAPSVDDSGRSLGLEVIFVEPDGYAARTQQLRLHDRIVEINGTSLDGVGFSRAQDLLRNALKTETILRLRVHSSSSHPRPTTSASSAADGDDALKDSAKNDDETSRNTEGRADHVESQVPEAHKSKAPVAPPARNTGTTLTTKAKYPSMFNTRMIGQKIKISLKKGDQGLGFSVTTRDNPSGGDTPIYIKNILPQGAAILDGRLRSGDRLLEINGATMTGKRQSDVVAVLREVKVGDAVELVISRHLDDDEQQDEVNPPSSSVAYEHQDMNSAQQDNEDHMASEHSSTEKMCKVLRLQIATADHGSDLGISLKGRTEVDGRDTGLFIQSISSNGPAKRDGRLSVNDKILEVNGRSLVGATNKEAMAILREALKASLTPGSVNLTVSRPVVETDTDLRVGQKKGGDTRNHESFGRKAFRNASYELATDDASTAESSDVKDSVSSTSKGGGGGASHQSRFEASRIGTNRPSKSSSGSESDSVKRASVATGSSDFEGTNLQAPDAFQREGIGRRSMSEKRRAYNDPKSSTFFQKLKDVKNRSDKDATLKRSSSVESIMSLSQTVGVAGESSYRRPVDSNSNAKPKRSNSFKDTDEKSSIATKSLPFAELKSRKWNESFRAAVDRSYAEPSIIAPPDGFRNDTTRGRGYEPRLTTMSKSVAKNSDISTFAGPSKNISPVTVVEGKNYSSTNANYVYLPPDERQIQSGYRRYEQGSANLQTGRNGYHGFQEMTSAHQANDYYSGYHTRLVPTNTRPDVNQYSGSRFAPSHPAAVDQHYMPPIGSQPCLNIHQLLGEHTGSLDSPKRNQIRQQNRSTTAEFGRRNLFFDGRPQSGDDQRRYNDVQFKNHPTNADGMLSRVPSFQNGYLHDLTNMTKSSHELWSSSANNTRPGRHAYEHPNDPRVGIQAGSSHQLQIGNNLHRKDDAQRQRGLIISSGAFV